MNLNPLFAKQKQLDEYIIKEKRLEGQDLLPRKTVALICELYECVNEARFFKYWSENQKPIIEAPCLGCDGEGGYIGYVNDPMPEKTLIACSTCNGAGYYNPLLEEFVDTIHFVLSIANDLGVHEHKYIQTELRDLNKLTLGITNLATVISVSKSKEHVKSLINNVIALGYQLGLTEKDVLEAYDKKNAVNYERQKVGY